MPRHSRLTVRLRRTVASIALAGLALLGVSLAAPASADPSFTISGQVSSLVGYPAGAAQVASGFYDGSAWQYSPSVDVGADGVFSLGETTGAGEYDLYFSVSGFSVPFVDSYYESGLVEPDATVNTNSGVIYDPTATDTTVNVTLAPAGYISGTVTSVGVALAGQDVESFDTITNDEYDANAPSDSSGFYSIKVPAGDPMVIGMDSDPSDYFPNIYNNQLGLHNHFDMLTVGAGQTKTGVDFSLVSTASYIAIELDVETPGATPSDLIPVDAATAHLFVSDGPGDDPQLATSYVDGGEGLIVSSSVGDYQFQFTNAAGKIYAIDSFGIDPGDEFTPVNPCVADLGAATGFDVDEDTLSQQEEGEIEFTLDPDLSICNSTTPTPPTAPAPPVHHRTFAFGGSTTTTVATPTPTPMPTQRPSASPSPTASSTPAPAVTSSASGLPWWAWLLIIIVGILILAGIAFLLFRRR